jgi:AraC-like DNA-binding protein
VRTLYFATKIRADVLVIATPHVVRMTPLMREIVLRVPELVALDERDSSHQRLLGWLLDEMSTAPLARVELPLPEDTRALAVARHVLKRPSSTQTVGQLAREHGLGRCTLERRFQAQTGLSFGLWRQKARKLNSIRLLAEGKSVAQAGFDAGYESVSAFIVAFKQAFGSTPSRRAGGQTDLTADGRMW